MANEVSDKAKLQQFSRNLSAMAEQLKAAKLTDSLHNLRRKAGAKDGNNPFAAKLKKEYSPVYNAMFSLPGYSTLHAQTTGQTNPKEGTIASIAEFCSRAFAFVEPISPDDLLTQDLSPFPPLLRTGQWKRYQGVYRCFYFNPDYPESKDEEPQLHGGLLKLQDDGARLRAFLVTGIRRDKYLLDLERIMEAPLNKDLYEKCKAYSDSHPDYEMRLVTYQGYVRTELQGYFLMQLHRHKHTNTALVLLRRWDESAQLDYSGGIASVTLCRKSKIASHAMMIVRPKLSLSGDEAFFVRHLNKADAGAKGMRVTAAMDEEWNRDMLERIRAQADRNK